MDQPRVSPYIAHARAYTEWQSKPAVLAHWYENSLAEEDLGKWPSSDIVSLALGLIDGLAYALTSARVIHQDIKPTNILLDDCKTPHLTDFGMARFAVERLTGTMSVDELRLTMHYSISLGPIGGTPLYMAPELFVGAVPSAKTDIFSLGVTLYEVLTGEHPFLGRETGYRFRPILRDGPLNLLIERRGSDLQSLGRLIASALNLNPESRPSSYDELLSTSGLQNTESSVRSADSGNDIIAQAAFLRARGRYEEAESLLRNSLQERPTNPMVLNSYSILLLAEGKKADAWDAWKTAIGSLFFTS